MHLSIKTHDLLIFRLSLLSMMMGVASVDIHAATDDNDIVTLDTVVSIGNRVNQKTIVEAPVPIDVISREQIEQTGFTALKDVLAQLVPSFQVVTSRRGNTFAAVTRPAGLRGLTGGYTLVLVNGKRRHPSSLVSADGVVTERWNVADLDLIPASAVERIEVLRDGAAAQYGSDAIAGVINLILKSSDQGGEAVTTIGSRYHFAADEPDNGQLYQQTLNYGFALPNDGVLNISLEAKKENNTVRSPEATQRFFPEGDAREDTVYRRVQRHGLPKVENIYFSYNYKQLLGEEQDLELYSFGTYGQREGENSTSYRFPYTTGNIIELYPNGVSPTYTFNERDYQLVAGLQNTDTNGWKWDISSSYALNDIDHGGKNAQNPSFGPDSPIQFHSRTTNYSQWVNNFDLSRKIDFGWRAPLQFATGIEYRHEKHENIAGDEAAYANGGYIFPEGHPLAGQAALAGAVGQTLIIPEDEINLSRNVYAGYIDLGLDITDQWYLALAGRYENYSDSAGDTLTGKVTTRYDFTPAFAVRSTISNGFSAPSLGQIAFASTSTSRRLLADGSWSQEFAKFLSVENPIAQQLGAKPLTPVESTNYSLGFTFTPSNKVNIAIDGYIIDINDRILSSESLSGSYVRNLLNEAGFPHITTVSYMVNGLDTRTKGLDLVANYNEDYGKLGKVKYNLGFNWNKTSVKNVVSTPKELEAAGLNLFGRNVLNSITDAIPETNLSLGADWHIGKFNSTLRFTRYDRVTFPGVTEVTDQHYSAKWITDLDIGYRINKNIHFALGANNLFDVYPDKNTIEDKTGLPEYGTVSPFGYFGGFYYGRLTLNF